MTTELLIYIYIHIILSLSLSLSHSLNLVDNRIISIEQFQLTFTDYTYSLVIYLIKLVNHIESCNTVYIICLTLAKFICNSMPVL